MKKALGLVFILALAGQEMGLAAGYFHI